MWHPRWHQLARVTSVFVVTSWLIAVVVQLTNSDTPIGLALVGSASLRAAGLGLAVGLVWGPLAAWAQGSVFVRAAAALAAGLLANITGVYVYFLVWPPEWDPGSTLKVVQLFLFTYGIHVLPIGASGGLLAGLFASRVKMRTAEEA